MSNSEKVQEEELKKLEDEAYFELCQIIAEAMETQDVGLLDSRIASWKNKYKKLLDRPSTSSRSDFKKRIEFLLTQYYSSVTQYILNQLKLKEEKKIENQAKAMRELYNLIKDTNDLDLLKKKVEKWKQKYPVPEFLTMYQKRIRLYTREKNLEENSFKQEEAFSGLVDITKKKGTLDELKKELSLWEEKYSINDKYRIDDFINHQSEIKRFISDEFLQSIAREEPTPDNIDKNEIDIVSEYNNKSFSNLAMQASAYTSLMAISKSPNSINEMFTWVYKNRNIQFNDKYKQLILSATYLDYSPTYLNKLPKPKIDILDSSLSFDEYQHITDIKRYAIISYFNLLLPPDKMLSNDYFNKHIYKIYNKSEISRTSGKINEPSLKAEEMISLGIEISLEKPNNSIYEVASKNINQETKKASNLSIVIPDENEVINISIEDNKQIEDEEPTISEKVTQFSEKKIENINESFEKEVENISEPSEIEPEVESETKLPDESESITTPSAENDSTTSLNLNEDTIVLDFSIKSDKKLVNSKSPLKDLESTSQDNKKDNPKDLDYATIVAVSPLFFAAVNNLDKQSRIVEHIDNDVNNYMESEKLKESTTESLEFNISAKTKSDFN